MSLPAHIVEDAVARALAEDLGLAGDITTDACVPEAARSRAVIRARAGGVVGGVDLARAAFRLVDDGIEARILKGDGARVAPGDAIIEIDGPARGVLTAERVALNFLGHLSGVATATAALVEAAKGTGAAIVCTRKTTPGLRALEKYAVRCGGGANHRFGLHDAAMIKDNHIAAAGGLGAALGALKARIGHLVKVEVEIDRLDQLDEAIAGGADVILLDNMSTDELSEAVRRAGGRVLLEASGGVTAETVAGIAATGVDLISSGWITHSAPSLDVGLDFLPAETKKG